MSCHRHGIKMLSLIGKGELVDPRAIDGERLEDVVTYVRHKMNLSIDADDINIARDYFMLNVPLDTMDWFTIDQNHVKNLDKLGTKMSVTQAGIDITIRKTTVSQSLRYTSMVLQGIGVCFFVVGISQFSGFVIL